jgi:hypothetical protein
MDQLPAPGGGRLEAGVQLGQLGLLTRLRRGTDPTDSPDRQPTTNLSVRVEDCSLEAIMEA